MNNYDEIAKEAVSNITGFYPSNKDIRDNFQNCAPLYACAYKAAQLQAERFNKDLDDSYIEYLELQKQYKNEEELI